MSNTFFQEWRKIFYEVFAPLVTGLVPGYGPGPVDTSNRFSKWSEKCTLPIECMENWRACFKL